MPRNRPSARSFRPASLEPLEPRSLLSSNFAFVAIGQGGGASPELQWGEGSFNDDGTVTGTYTFATATTDAQTQALPYDHASFLPGGRFNVTPAPGSPALTAQVGLNPLTTQGYALGALSVEYDTLFGPARTDGFLTQQFEGFSNWAGGYNFRALRITAAGRQIISGSVSFNTIADQNPLEVTWTIDGEAPVTKSISNLGPRGKVTLATGEVIFLTHPGENATGNSVALIADLDRTDGQILIGIGAGEPLFSYGDSAGVSGLYRGLAIADGTLGRTLLGATAEGAAPFVLDLTYDGTFKLYEAKAYDAGQRTPVTTGTWRVSRFSDSPTFEPDRLLLTQQGSGATLVLAVTPDQQWTFETARVADGTPVEEIVGAMRMFRPLQAEQGPEGITVNLENGRPVVYQISYHDTNSTAYTWYSLDLIDRAGGKPLSTVQIVAQEQSNHEHVIAGIATDGDVLVWERDYRGVWIFRNLTETLAGQGAVRIASDGVVYSGLAYQVRASSTGNLPVLYIAGRSITGDLVSYAVGSTVDDYGTQAWTFTNVSQTQLAPYGETAPAWTSSVIGYGTTWGGQNIAGLDASGQIIVAWTAPGLSRWYVNNLSQNAGTPALAGSLMAYVTGWSAIHVNGLTLDGHLVSTWWAPANIGTWYANDLTSQFSGPVLPQQRPNDAVNNLVYFAGAGGSLNIVAYDNAENAVVYWWFPGAPGWLVANLTGSVPINERPHELIGADTFRGYADNQSLSTRQNIYGHDDTGKLVRLYWEEGGPDVWRAQNITDVAVALPE